jgi:hypothetical protein
MSFAENMPFVKMIGRFVPKGWPLGRKAYKVACEAR